MQGLFIKPSLSFKNSPSIFNFCLLKSFWLLGVLLFFYFVASEGLYFIIHVMEGFDFDRGSDLKEFERLLLVTFQTSFYGNFDFLGN